MNSTSDENPNQYLTTVGTLGDEMYKVFSTQPHDDDGFNFDGKPYTDADAKTKYLKFRSGYGDFYPTPAVVPGLLVWKGKEFGILSIGDNLIWMDFQTTDPDAGS